MKRLLIAMLFTIATPALAQPYVLIGIGQGEASVTGNPDGIAWAFGGGYRFNRFIGVELSAHRLKASDTGPIVADTVTDTESTSWATALSAVGEIPVGSFAIIGKLGAAQVRHRLVTETFDARPFQFRSLSRSEAKETDTGRLVGFGLRYKVLRLMHERISGVEGIGVDRLRYTTLQVAVPF